MENKKVRIITRLYLLGSIYEIMTLDTETVPIPNSPSVSVDQFREALSICAMEDIRLLATPAEAIREVEMATTDPAVDMPTERSGCNNERQSTPKKRKFGEPRFISETTTADWRLLKKLEGFCH